jgi:hypothetical protein
MLSDIRDVLAKWLLIANEKPSDNMIYHAPTIRAILADLAEAINEH